MPDVIRTARRFSNEVGLDLVNPIDRMPPGSYPYLFNARVLEEGGIDARPGYGPGLTCASGIPNSIIRLNDPDADVAPSGFAYVAGAGTGLDVGQTLLSQVDTGYSGNPLSLIDFRPEQSPEGWVYVYDQNKLAKVQAGGVVRPIGVAPPVVEPSADYGTPAVADVSTGQSTSGWTHIGNISSITAPNRMGTGVTATIGTIVYNNGTTGWACLSPSSTSPFNWAGNRMKIILSSGSEAVVVREIHPAITTTTIAGIIYDAGSTGPCSIVLVGSPIGLARNSLLTLSGTETVRVLSVTLSPDGSTYSLRASTTLSHAAGDSAAGLLSWYVYTVGAHTAGESITTLCVYAHGTSLGSAKSAQQEILNYVSENAGVANSRPIEIANDWMHISLWITNAPALVSLSIGIDIDSNTSSGAGNAFTNNYILWSFTPSQIFGGSPPSTPNAGFWYDLTFPLSQGVRYGQDPSVNLTGIKAIQISTLITGVTDFAFDWWYVFGTYGPVIQPNAPSGYTYYNNFRDSTTGAASVVGPPTRYTLNPLREEVIVTPATTPLVGVDSCDIYRQGGTLSTINYVGTVPNNNAAPNQFGDISSDLIVAANPVADPTLIQPWPLLGLAWSGQVNVVGTSVTWVSGTQFNQNLISATVILINGVAYQTYGSPQSSTFLEIFLDAGVQTNVPFLVTSPTVAAQPLPYAFGPMEGPFAPVVFALGDPVNGGNLYFSNGANLDAADSANFLEIQSPSEPLISGETWNGLNFVGTRDEIYMVRYTYLSAPGAALSSTSFQVQRIPSLSGMWCRWGVCSCPIGVAFIGRDGIYVATEQGAVSISDDKLYPIFPHNGTPGTTVNLGSNIILPVDMTKLTYMRLAACDQDLLFSYLDTGNNAVTLRYEIPKKRWFLHSYANRIGRHYLPESDLAGPNPFQILLLDTASDAIYQAGGATDNGTAINTLVLTPSDDGGDERSQKLYDDLMVQVGGTGSVQVAAAYDFAQSFSSVSTLSPGGAISQFPIALASLASGLGLHLNIGAKFAWTGGPGAIVLYALESSGYLQPYLTTRMVTQFIPLSLPGWKHHRRLYPGLISNSAVSFTVAGQNGQTYGPFTLGSTGGKYRIIPQLLPHGVKDLAFSYQLDGAGSSFAVFPDSFTLETKEWREASYIELAVLRS